MIRKTVGLGNFAGAREWEVGGLLKKVVICSRRKKEMCHLRF